MAEKVDNSEISKDAVASVEDFRKDLGPFVAAVENTRMPMVFTNAKIPGHQIIYANAGFLALTGYEITDVERHSLQSLMARGTTPEALSELAAGFAGQWSQEPEIHYRRADGSEFWATVFISPVHDQSGSVVQHFVSFVEITAHIQAERTAQILIDELNHRVKNTLATVQSIISLAFNSSSDVDEIRSAIEERVFALSRSHDILNRVQWKSVGLVDVLSAALEPFSDNDGGAKRFELEGDNILVSPKVALALGIAFHELATNALKHGALSNDAGSVRIAWVIIPDTDGNLLTITWHERNGPPVLPPSHRGFGSRVIERGLALELQGSVALDFRPDGVVCTIVIPAPYDDPHAG